MTTVVGVEANGFIVMGCDSRISSYDADGQVIQISTLAARDSKIASVGGILIGVAGDARAMNLLHLAFDPPPLPTFNTRKKVDQYMARLLVPAIRDLFEEHGYATIAKDTKSAIEQNSQVMIGVHNRLFVIEGDYGWSSDRQGVYAIGTGSAYALGALHATIKDKDLTLEQTKEAVFEALLVAATYDPNTGGPFKVVHEKMID